MDEAGLTYKVADVSMNTKKNYSYRESTPNLVVIQLEKYYLQLRNE